MYSHNMAANVDHLKFLDEIVDFILNDWPMVEQSLVQDPHILSYRESINSQSSVNYLSIIPNIIASVAMSDSQVPGPF